MGDSYLQYTHDCLGLRLSVRVADVDHMEQDLCVLDLLESRPGVRMEMERGSKGGKRGWHSSLKGGTQCSSGDGI